MSAPPAAPRDVSHALAPAYVWKLRVEHFGALESVTAAAGCGGAKREPGAPAAGVLHDSFGEQC
jgi:hypothetical protein